MNRFKNNFLKGDSSNSRSETNETDLFSESNLTRVWLEVKVIGLLNPVNSALIPEKILPKGPKENIIPLCPRNRLGSIGDFTANLSANLLLPIAVSGHLVT